MGVSGGSSQAQLGVLLARQGMPPTLLCAPSPQYRACPSIRVCGVKIHTEPVAYGGAQGSCCEEEFSAEGFSFLWSVLGFSLRLKQRLSGWKSQQLC